MQCVAKFCQIITVHCRHRVNAVLDPNNAGVLIVEINSNMGEHSVGPDEISRRLERNDESCIIM